MAYTIISQNNSTTTLSDGVNTITVPSRVNLTSGNFTIVEVNNNMATLEDGDGNVYRDIPCVATLAGEGGGGGSALPDQTGHSGEFLTTDGGSASWGTTVNKISIINDSNTTLASIGGTSRTIDVINNGGSSNVSLKFSNNANPAYVYLNAMSWAFYPSASKSFGSIGKPSNWWLESYVQNTHTEKINNGADITVPAVSGELAVKQVNSTITLAAADWSGGSQTVTVTGMTATGVVLVSPDPTDQSAYTSAGILCTAQAANSLTFTCSTTPSADIDVNVVML